MQRRHRTHLTKYLSTRCSDVLCSIYLRASVLVCLLRLGKNLLSGVDTAGLAPAVEALAKWLGRRRFEYRSSWVGVMFSSFLGLARLNLESRELLCRGRRLLMLLIACDVEPPDDGGLSRIESLVRSPELPSRL